jgi:multidrug resistance efflux pump
MNQRTPYTSEAVLKAPVIGIAANVSGDIIEVGVRDNQRVKAGDLLFQIDPALFETALKAANAQLEYTIQTLGAEATGLGAAEAAVVQAAARLAMSSSRTSEPRPCFRVASQPGPPSIRRAPIWLRHSPIFGPPRRS